MLKDPVPVAEEAELGDRLNTAFNGGDDPWPAGGGCQRHGTALASVVLWVDELRKLVARRRASRPALEPAVA